MNLQPGDILICRADRIISKLIMKATHSHWSHTALYVELWGQPSIIEAQSKGIFPKLYEDWKTKWNYEYIVFRKKEIDQKEIQLKAFSKCGGKTAYDFESFIIRQPIKLITGKWRDRGEETEGRKMICSEFTGWVYNLPKWYSMTPQEQYEYLSNSPQYEEISQA